MSKDKKTKSEGAKRKEQLRLNEVHENLKDLRKRGILTRSQYRVACYQHGITKDKTRVPMQRVFVETRLKGGKVTLEEKMVAVARF